MTWPDAAELAIYSGYDFSAADLTRGELLLELAIGEVRRFTGQNIAPPVETSFVEHVWREPYLHLPHPRVIPVTVGEVKVDGEVVDVTRVALHGGQANMLHRDDGRLWLGKVEVTYTHGFAEAPDDVRQIVLERAAAMYVNPEAAMQRRRADASTAFASSQAEATGLNESQKRRLGDYRLTGVA